MLRICWVILVLVLVGCRAPAVRKCSLSAAASNAEALAGTGLAPSVESRFGGVLRDETAERRMRGIGRQLVQHALVLLPECEFRLLRADCRNAVSLPGGYIYVTLGLYRDLLSDDLLAATLAHELAHLAAKDHFQQTPCKPDHALRKEQRADSAAVALLDAAGFDSRVLVDLVFLVSDAQPPGWAAARAKSIRNLTHQSDKVALRPSVAALVRSRR